MTGLRGRRADPPDGRSGALQWPAVERHREEEAAWLPTHPLALLTATRPTVRSLPARRRDPARLGVPRAHPVPPCRQGLRRPPGPVGASPRSPRRPRRPGRRLPPPGQPPQYPGAGYPPPGQPPQYPGAGPAQPAPGPYPGSHHPSGAATGSGYPPPGYPQPGYPPPGYPQTGGSYPPPGAATRRPGYPPPGYPYPRATPRGPAAGCDVTAAGTDASWGIRVGAYVIDYIIVAVVTFLVNLPLRHSHVWYYTFHISTATHGTRYYHGSALGFVFVIVVSILYGTLFCGSSLRRTPGMMAVGLQTANAETGGPIGYGKALARSVMQWVFFRPIRGRLDR